MRAFAWLFYGFYFCFLQVSKILNFLNEMEVGIMTEEISMNFTEENFLSVPEDKPIDVNSRGVWVSCPRDDALTKSLRYLLKILEVGTQQRPL